MHSENQNMEMEKNERVIRSDADVMDVWMRLREDNWQQTLDAYSYLCPEAMILYAEAQRRLAYERADPVMEDVWITVREARLKLKHDLEHKPVNTEVLQSSFRTVIARTVLHDLLGVLEAVREKRKLSFGSMLEIVNHKVTSKPFLKVIDDMSRGILERYPEIPRNAPRALFRVAFHIRSLLEEWSEALYGQAENQSWEKLPIAIDGTVLSL